MNFTFDASDLDAKLVQPLLGSPQRLRNAVAAALTKTAVDVREAQRAEMRDVFDRPTPYTLGSLFVEAAQGDAAFNTLGRDEGGAQTLVSIPNAGKIEALVGIKTNVGGSRSALSWLRWQIAGGLRTQTAFERRLIGAGAMRNDQRMVPGRAAKLDAFGNVSRGQLVQILSQLRIDSTVGSTRSLPRIGAEDNAATQRAKRGTIRRAYKRAGGQYFALPNGRGKLPPGIYIARDTGFGRTDPKPVLLFVSKAQYENRFDFWYVADLAVQRNLPRHLTGQLAAALLRKEAGAGTKVTVQP